MISSVGSKVCRLSLNSVKCPAVAVVSRFSSSSSSSSHESYTEKQAKTGRPVSPHVTIYRFPIAAISSISNRVTGVALTAGVTAIGGLTLVGIDTTSIMMTIGNSPVGPIAKIAVAFPLVFHYLAGVRHILWDKNPEEYLSNEEVHKSSYILFGVAGAMSLIAAAL